MKGCRMIALLLPILVIMTVLCAPAWPVSHAGMPSLANQSGPYRLPFHTSAPHKTEMSSTAAHPGSLVGSWSRFPAPYQNTLQSAVFPTPDLGWAVGITGWVLEWDGAQWTRFGQLAQERLEDLDCVSITDCWVVGFHGTILHWDGVKWTQVPSPTDYDLYAVDFLSPTLGWAVGGALLSDPPTFAVDRVILQWNGEIWQEVPAPKIEPFAFELVDVAMVSADNGWATGSGSLLHWNGVQWREVLSEDNVASEFDFMSISVLSADDIWMVGEDRRQDIPGEGVIYHWDGEQWKENYRTRLPLLSIAMVDSDFGWAAGGDYERNSGRSLLLHWDGTAWNEMKVPARYPFQFVWAESHSDGWLFAGGSNPNSGFDGEVFRFTLPVITPTAPALTSSLRPTKGVTSADNGQKSPQVGTSAPTPSMVPENPTRLSMHFGIPSIVAGIAVFTIFLLLLLRSLSRRF
jgi:hypothetical protein